MLLCVLNAASRAHAWIKCISLRVNKCKGKTERFATQKSFHATVPGFYVNVVCEQTTHRIGFKRFPQS